MSLNPQFVFGCILLLGLLVGQLAKSTQVFPKITGYLLFGLIFGPNVLNIITKSVLIDTKPFTDFAIALCALSIGLQFNIRFLAHHKSILWTSLIEIITTFTLVFVSLTLLKVDSTYAVLISIISITSLPIMTKLHCQAGGNEFITKKSLVIAAMNNLIAFVLFMLVIPFANNKAITISIDSFLFIFNSIYRLIGPFILVICIAKLTIELSKFITRSEKIHFTLIMSIVLICMGAARMLGLSGIISSLLLGATLANLDKDDSLMRIELGYSSELFFILLFVMTGASLHISQVIAVGGIALTMIAARFIGKLLPTLLLSKQIGLSSSQSYILSLTLYPMAGTAISLINIAKDYSTDLEIVASVILAAISIIEFTAPLLHKFTIKKPEFIEGAELLIHR